MLLLLATSAVARIAAADDPTDPNSPVAASGTTPTQGEPTVIIPVPPKEPTAADVAGAPPPGSETGRLDVEPGDSPARQIARGWLFFPKLLFYAVEAPVLGGLYATDKYDLKEKYYTWFYNDPRTLGIIPVGAFVSGFGVTVGARALAQNYFGHQENAYLEATFGLQARQDHRLYIDTGDLLGHRTIGALFANFDHRPNDRFFGIGNGNVVSPQPENVDPITEDIAFPTRYKYTEVRVGLSASVRMWRDLFLVPAVAYTSVKSAHSPDDVSVEEVFNPMDLVSFDDTFHHFYPTLELRWDSRRWLSRWEPEDVHAAGELVSIAAGPVVQFGEKDFWHVVGEAQYNWRVRRGPSVLTARFHGEGVTGSYDNIPFPELPYLGGVYLRGYEYNRFRDRVAMFGTVQYLWDISTWADAYVFTDVGRVYSSLSDVTWDGLRCGFGLGVEFHSLTGFVGEAMIASSVDGGVFATVSLNPILDSQPRWR